MNIFIAYWTIGINMHTTNMQCFCKNRLNRITEHFYHSQHLFLIINKQEKVYFHAEDVKVSSGRGVTSVTGLDGMFVGGTIKHCTLLPFLTKNGLLNALLETVETGIL